MYKKPKYREAETLNVKEGISALLKAYRLEPRFNETMAVAIWEQLMGQSIAKRTVTLQVRKGVMYIKLSSAPLKQELSTSKKRIVDLINQEIGAEAISEIVFL